MPKEAQHLPLSRPLRVEEIEEGVGTVTTATETEMAAIAKLLDLVALDALALNYRIRRGGEGRLYLSGSLKARVTQTCVVSLDPVTASLDVPVEVEFCPAASIEPPDVGAPGAEMRDWPEPIIEGRIDFGPLIYETLATALDPYPRREGASFEWSQGADLHGSGTGPFAALEVLKRR